MSRKERENERLWRVVKAAKVLLDNLPDYTDGTGYLRYANQLAAAVNAAEHPNKPPYFVP